MKEYFWYNNRKWTDDLWEKGVKRASYIMASKPEFVEANAKQKNIMLGESTCNAIFGVMNFEAFYFYSPNISDDKPFTEFDPESTAGTFTPNDSEALDNDQEVIYSAAWNGNFTRREIEYMDAYYAELLETNDLSDRTMRDYARKICKASLNQDIAFNKYRRGLISSKELADATVLFDTLNKSSNFAACRRKAGDVITGNSFSELTARIQPTGKIEKIKVKWDKDDVDHCIDEYYHIAASLGIGEMS